jgi:hypothetical protein
MCPTFQKWNWWRPLRAQPFFHLQASDSHCIFFSIPQSCRTIAGNLQSKCTIRMDAVAIDLWLTWPKTVSFDSS